MRLKFLRIPVKLSMLAFCVYFGYTNADNIEKLRLNLFERRTNVRKGYYENITNLKIFLDKEEGYFVPKYGTDDFRIEIGEDMLPKNVYSLLERKIKNGNNNIYETISFFDSIISYNSNSIDKKDRINLINDLKKNIALLEDSPEKWLMYSH